MPNIPTDVLKFLEQPYHLTQEQINHYGRYRYIKLKQVTLTGSCFFLFRSYHAKGIGTQSGNCKFG
jgi:hypothetical protein